MRGPSRIMRQFMITNMRRLTLSTRKKLEALSFLNTIDRFGCMSNGTIVYGPVKDHALNPSHSLRASNQSAGFKASCQDVAHNMVIHIEFLRFFY